ncbi:MAG: hypothetical protein H2184_18790 [Candidatus Galacturonibacter soehngenii]|nr:hypothetical protein [Candidatus Galacturonibacter soehngenii]
MNNLMTKADSIIKNSNHSLNNIQEGLSLLGLGMDAADALNGVIYLLRGDNKQVALSLAALIPIGGAAVVGGKYIGKALKKTDKAEDTGKALKKVSKYLDDVIEGGLKIDIDVKPTVTNEKLKNIVNDLYKGQGGANTIGNGTTMDAVRNEILTGQPTNGKFHTSKLKDYVNALEKRLRAGDLNSNDEAVVKALLEDAKNALSGK